MLCSQRQRFPNTVTANVQRAPCASSATNADGWAIDMQQPLWERKPDFIASSKGRFNPGHQARGKTTHFNAAGSPRNTSVTPAAGNNMAHSKQLQSPVRYLPFSRKSQLLPPPHTLPASYRHPQGGRAASPFSEPGWQDLSLRSEA